MHPAQNARRLVTAIVMFAAAGGAASQSATRTKTSHAAATANAAPVIGDLQAFNLTSACDAHPGAPNCAGAVARGALLFAWTCANCSASWQAVFVVNGQPTAANDIVLAPSKLLALSARAGQFKLTDCIAVRIYNPASPSQNVTSNAFCIAQLHMAQAPAQTSPSATAIAPGAHPPSPCALNVPCTAAPAKSTASVPALTATATGGKSSTSTKNAMNDPNFVPAPSGLIGTTDPNVCSQHAGFGGAVACHAGLANGSLALVWTCKNCKVDGYRVYEMSPINQLIPANGAYATDKTITLALLDNPGQPFAGNCYAVTAVRGTNESNTSNRFCAGGGSVLSMVTLTPAHVLHRERSRFVNTGTITNTNEPATDAFDADLIVGFEMWADISNAGDSYWDRIHRTALYFDLTPLAGTTITKAVLQFEAQTSWHGVDKNRALLDMSPEACVTDVDKATDHWWINSDIDATVTYISPGVYMGPDFGIDVTKGVQGWLRNTRSNFGFVLRGANENDAWHGPQSSVCVTRFSSATLVVTYH